MTANRLMKVGACAALVLLCLLLPRFALSTDADADAATEVTATTALHPEISLEYLSARLLPLTQAQL